MRNLKTFVYFDLEATGLRSSGRPRITEISLIAVNVDDTLKLKSRIEALQMCRKSDETVLYVERLQPRIENKLTLCVYPMATIVPSVTDITGLDNYMLDGHSRFNENTANIINNFLSHLPSPVCLVAHNGEGYDFPLLKAEMERVKTPLNSSILCVDSYIGIKKIYEARQKASQIVLLKEEKEIKVIMSKPYTPSSLLNRAISMKYQRRTQQSCKSKKLKKSLSRAPKSFSLVNLHSHLLGFPPSKSHGAEEDCLTLLRTTALYGQDWIDWAQENCHLFTDCTEMWQMAVCK